MVFLDIMSKKAPRKDKKPLFKKITQAFLFGCLVFFVGILGIFLYYAKDLPRPEKFTELSFVLSTKIYDRTGEHLLYEIYGEEKREVVPLDQISQSLKEAIIATEDADFYHHHGIDPKGILRSLLINVRSLSPLQGGSTLTQQLVRTSFLSRTKTVERKVKEIILTLELERRYSKDQILEFYLNQIPLGSNAYGVSEGSKLLFGKEPSALTLEESATIAALIKAPSYFSPFGPHRAGLLERKNYVLDRMQETGYITKEDAAAAKEEQIVFLDPSENITAPHFTLGVVAELSERYGEEYLRENGLRVKTTLDWDLQQGAEKTVAEFSKANVSYEAHNAALVAIDPKTGEILAMIGSKDWFGDEEPAGCIPGSTCSFDPKLNVATASPGRQPGSAFKPFVYATAFTKGSTDSTVVVDEPTNFGVWGGEPYAPQNYDGKFRGPVSLRQALAQSLNVPAVKVLNDLAGLEDSINLAKAMGITTLNQGPSFYGLALVLGGGEVKLLDMVSAYGVFANEGKRAPAFDILEVQDSKGKILESRKNTSVTVLPSLVATEISDILADNEARTPIFGARSPLYFPNERVSVKTGTTQDYKDGWIIGYTNDVAAGVWVGNNNGQLMKKEPGSVVAGPMWHQFMEFAIQHLKTAGKEPATP